MRTELSILCRLLAYILNMGGRKGPSNKLGEDKTLVKINQEAIHGLIYRLMDFKSLLYLFICVTYPAIFIFILSCFVPVAPFLANSISTPWGIVTCIFVHVSQAHLYSNILLLALYLATFAFINIYHSRSTRVRKSSFLIYSSVLSALLANAFCLLINPREVSVGASGMVFAVEGAVFASALSNIASAPTFVSKLPRRVFLSSFFYNAYIVVFLAGFSFAPAVFFSIMPRVNYTVHILSFSEGILTMGVLEAYRMLKEPRKANSTKNTIITIFTLSK